jgi:hypothetical protein
MNDMENRVPKVIWRALGRHVKAGHQLEVKQMPDDQGMEISCSWCGGTVLAGSPGLIREIIKTLNDSGVPIVNLEAPMIESMRILQG